MSRRSPVFKFLPPDNATQQNKKISKDHLLRLPKDIQARKQYIEETFRILETAVEQSIDGIAVADMDGIIRFCNHTWAHMHGYHIFELIGKHLSIFHTEEQMKRDVIPFNEEVKKFGAYQGEVGHVRKDGTIVPTWMSTTILKNERGKPIGLVGIARDISEHKKIEKTLIESEEKYRKLFESSIEGIGVSKGNRVITANKALLDIFGYKSIEEFSKVPLLFHVALESRNMIRERMRKRQRGEWVEPRFEYKIIRKDGEIRDVEASSSEIIIGNDKHILTTFRDITEIKKTLREQNKLIKAIEISREAIHTTSPDLKIMSTNRAMDKMFGYKKGELIGKHPMILNAGPNPEVVANQITEGLERRDYWEGEIHNKRKDGTEFITYATITTVRDEDDKILNYISTQHDITERRKLEERISKINKCFINFGPDPNNNINSLVALVGDVMMATCALYSYLDGDVLCSIGRWNVPSDFNPVNKADGLTCYDVIKEGKDDLFVVRNLLESRYAQTDPYVLKYNLQTYIGLSVKLGEKSIGSLCVAYQNDFIPNEEDKKFMQIIASAIAVEEKRKSTEETLIHSEEKYRFLFEANSIVSLIIGIDMVIKNINKAALRNLGYCEDEIIGKKAIDFVIPEQKNKAIEELKKSFEGIYTLSVEIDVYAKDKSIHTLLFSPGQVLLYDGGSQPTSILLTAIDITEHKKIEWALEDKERFMSNVFSSIQDGISILDKDMKIVRVNPTIEEWYSHNMPLVGKKCYEAYHCRSEPCKVCPTTKTLKTGKAAYEVVPKTTLGGEIIGWLDLYSFPLSDVKTGQIQGVIEYVRDITERRKIEKRQEILNNELLKSNRRLKQLVLRDSHTGLYNHRYLQEAIEAEFCRAQRYTQPLSVIMLDIDYFKSVNDVYGHQLGDLILKQFSRELKKMVRKYDTVVRFGGEEFIIISPEVNKPIALTLAQRILDSISLCDFGREGQSVKLRLSLAVSSYPDDRVAKGIGLIELADRILNKAKEDGGNRVYSSRDIEHLKTTVLEKIKKRVDVKFLRGKIDRLNRRANQGLIESVLAFAKTIKLKDNYTGEHVESTVRYAMQIAERLNLTKDEIENIRRASMLHDLGKIGISESILNKKRKLTPREFLLIKRHPQIGADILRQIHFLRDIIPLIHYHHERWDGKGYPCGLRKEEIPMGARIVAIADVFQALISDRPYRRAYPEDKAKQIIQEGSGSQFDPIIVDTFLKILQR